MRAESRTKSRVGIVVFTALILFAVAIMVIGGKTGFFLARTSYYARFPNSQGIVQGNQVRLAGVTVGAVRRVEVPEKPGENLTIHFDIEKRYQHLVKVDSRVEIKTIGLLGDKYLEVTPGSPGKMDLEPGHEIMAYRGAELDKILAGSGDLVDNVVAITKSLKNILGRTERGEGFLGEITSSTEAGRELSRSLRQTLDSASKLIVEIREGQGLLGTLIKDKGLVTSVSTELSGATASLHRILSGLESGMATGKGLVPALLSDPEGRKKFFAMVDSLHAAADGLARFSHGLSDGHGLAARLVKDDEFARTFLQDLKTMSGHLAHVAAKIDSTDGTAGKLIADPSLYEALNDIVVGIDESKMLRWLARNRQKAGIEKRYKEAQKTGTEDSPAPAPAPK